MLKVKRKHEWEDWHHRAPDFRLVYCGPKNRVKEDAKLHKEKIEDPITNAEHVAVVESCINESKKPKS
jgi:hypothetical protein